MKMEMLKIAFSKDFLNHNNVCVRHVFVSSVSYKFHIVEKSKY